MGDLVHVPGPSKNSKTSTNFTNKIWTKCSMVASSPRLLSEKMVKRMVPLKHLGKEGGTSRGILWFLVKVAALEGVRRFSKVKCPLIWKVLQGLQILSYSPFKLLQRWAPIKNLVKGMQAISKPLLLLSATTAFSDYSENSKKPFNNAVDSQQHSESSALQPTSNLRASEEATEDVSENWLLQLRGEIEKQGVVLPERINDDELHRFYTAANGDFSCLMRSIRRTIRWRETYGILSLEELESWSHLVFWHGFDVKLRPCLIIRLGLACASLSSPERPRFAQAVVSQMEHGVLFLVNQEDPQITVVMDCEGLSPFRSPMQMMRSCSILMQDHYPNRLGTLFVIRLPPVVRVIAQTFIQVGYPSGILL
uniref:SEC14 cytosolic factor n=1 Tax=Anthurium amnicola TaxID=1678845 RepID=A0A1D1XPE3_9ARAE